MSCEVFTGKLECKVSAKRMWCGAFKDAHNCLPKACSEAIARVEYEGGGCFEPGCVRIIHFNKSHAEKLCKEKHPEHPVVMYVKEKLEEVDHHNFKLKAEVVEGGFKGILVKCYKYSVHIKEGHHHGTCEVNYCFEYEALPGKQHGQIKDVFKEVGPLCYTGVEAYLLANNDYAE